MNLSELTYKRLSPETWKDFETLFTKYHGVRGGCWCAEYLTYSSEFQKMPKDDRRQYHKQLCMENKANGILAYHEGEPIAWCQFGSPDVVRRQSRGRDYSKLVIAEEDKPDYRISCVFIDKKYRKNGISRYMIKAALSEISAMGGGVVEVFPFDPEHTGSTRVAHNGSLKLFIELGFSVVTKLGATILLMRKVVI